MKRTGYRFSVLVSALALQVGGAVLLCGVAGASTGPRVGGRLRVEMVAANVSLDPREWKPGSPDAASSEKVSALIFERLVAIDRYGQVQPQLAIQWSHDEAFKKWQFTVRSGVKFSDGTDLTAADVVAALQALLPKTISVTEADSSVVLQCAEKDPQLLLELGSGRYFIFKVAASGELVGTGPFAIPKNSARTSSMVFEARENYWGGRAFVDLIEITLNVPPLRALLDMQVGRADLVQLSPELVRRARQDNVRVWASAPVIFFALQFADGSSGPDAKTREALALTLDRNTMSNVLLQKQAEPASALLPQWLSGYAFLFKAETRAEGNVEQAKEMYSRIAEHKVTPALRLQVEAAGDLAKLLAERVAVNARQAGITVQVVTQNERAKVLANAETPAAGRLFAWRISSLSPGAELCALGTFLDVKSMRVESSADAQQLYEQERAMLSDFRLLPLVAMPEYVALGPKVRDWMATDWGEWSLADVWLDTAGETAPPSGGAKP